MDLQVIGSPDGEIRWVSGPLPGSVHDKTAEWIRATMALLDSISALDMPWPGSRE
jgi:hypothetical protein